MTNARKNSPTNPNVNRPDGEQEDENDGSSVNR